jgi:hypothetical protein
MRCLNYAYIEKYKLLMYYFCSQVNSLKDFNNSMIFLFQLIHEYYQGIS